MHEYIYAVRVSHSKNPAEVILTVPDFDDLICVFSEEDAPPETYYELAEDGILAALEARIAAKDQVPIPTRIALRAGDFEVVLKPLVVLKLFLYTEMFFQGVKQSELARRLHKAEGNVRRLLDLRHSSRVDQIVDALEALGVRRISTAYRDAEDDIVRDDRRRYRSTPRHPKKSASTKDAMSHA